MSADRMRRIAIMALAQNADPEDADMVLSQALTALTAEARAIRSKIEEDTEDAVALSYSHENRLQALEDLFDNYMAAKWNDAAQAEAAE